MSALAATNQWWRVRDRVVRALLLSVLVHLLLYGTWSLGNRYHVWEMSFLPRWLLPVKSTKDAVAEALKRAQEVQPRQPELVFVDVSQQQATPDAPEDAQYYSAQNSRAANPTRDADSNTPKIDGQQVNVFKTVDVERPAPPQPQPLQPSVPRPTPAEPLEPQEARPKAEPRPTLPVGDLALIKPSTTERDSRGDAEKRQEEQKPREKPRTIAEALARQGIQGQRIKQAGGVGRIEPDSSVNAKATPFGAYDQALIAAVQSHWYGLIEQNRAHNMRSGRVVVEFRLLSDGRVSNVKISEESVGELLSLYCQLAIEGAAPFAPWPSDLRRLAGDSRDVRFTFYYN